MKDGKSLMDFSSEPVYKIQSIKRDDAGVYQCVARNSVGSIFSDKVQVVVACKSCSFNSNRSLSYDRFITLRNKLFIEYSVC